MLAHSQTLRLLNSFIKQPAHALALNGPEGSGKLNAACFVASQLLSIPLESIENSQYVYRLSAGSDKSGIDAVRQLQKFLVLKVPGGSHIKRIVIIEDLDKFGREAQNAMLKTLEEPPEDTVIIATYSQEQYLLPTIHSRMQHINVLPIDLKTAHEYFADIPDSEITKAYYMSGGLADLFESLVKGDTDHPLVKSIEKGREIIRLDRYGRLAMVDKLVKDKQQTPEQILEGLYRLLEAIYKQSLKTKSEDDIKPIAARLAMTEQALRDLSENVQPKLVFSRLFLEL